MTRAEIVAKIKEEIKKGNYTEGQESLFRAEYGWDTDWMPEYTEAPDDEEISEEESREIENIISEAWYEYWEEKTRNESEDETVTKYEMAEIIVNSPSWDGEKDARKLCDLLSEEEIREIFDMLDDAEEEYYDYKYGNAPYTDGMR